MSTFFNDFLIGREGAGGVSFLSSSDRTLRWGEDVVLLGSICLSSGRTFPGGAISDIGAAAVGSR